MTCFRDLPAWVKGKKCNTVIKQSKKCKWNQTKEKKSFLMFQTEGKNITCSIWLIIVKPDKYTVHKIHFFSFSNQRFWRIVSSNLEVLVYFWTKEFLVYIWYFELGNLVFSPRKKLATLYHAKTSSSRRRTIGIKDHTPTCIPIYLTTRISTPLIITQCFIIPFDRYQLGY